LLKDDDPAKGRRLFDDTLPVLTPADPRRGEKVAGERAAENRIAKRSRCLLMSLLFFDLDACHGSRHQ